MTYNITKATAPAMPSLGKGTECIRLLLSQTSKDMHEPLVPMLFPILGAHISGTEFQYPDLTWKELCGQMANLMADSGSNKGQLSLLVEAICRDFCPKPQAPISFNFERWLISSYSVEVWERPTISCVGKGSLLGCKRACFGG